MKLTKYNIKTVKQAITRLALAFSILIRGLQKDFTPLLGILWRNKIALVSVINAIVAGSLVIVLSIRFVNLINGRNYWWSIGNQSGIVSANRFDYVRSIAQNNIPIVFISFLFTVLLLIQTVKILTRARIEKWDKKSKNKLVRQIGLTFYSVIVIGLAIVYLN